MTLDKDNLSRLYTDQHAVKERYMHTCQQWEWGKNAEYFFPWQDQKLVSLSNIIEELAPSSVLDYGCGQGYATDKLIQQFPQINFYNYDPFVEKYSVYPTTPCELVVSNNALHHVETRFYDQVVENLYHLSNKTALIKLYVINGHRSTEWYVDQFSKLFTVKNVIESTPLANDPDKVLFLYGVESDKKTPLYLHLLK